MVARNGLPLFWTRDNMLLIYNRSKVLCSRMSKDGRPRTGQAGFLTILFGIGWYLEMRLGASTVLGLGTMAWYYGFRCVFSKMGFERGTSFFGSIALIDQSWQVSGYDSASTLVHTSNLVARKWCKHIRSRDWGYFD